MWRLVTNSLASHGQPLLKYDECPEYLKSNPYIRTGYVMTLMMMMTVRMLQIQIWPELAPVSPLHPLAAQ